MDNNKLVLIDGHALAYRMFFALPLEQFTTKNGEHTNATFGFVRRLLDLIISDDPPKYLAVSFDVGRTFRDDWFEEYKGTREKMPDELRDQIARIQEVVKTLNIPVLTLDGYEADDVLGTIARQAKKFDVPVTIITGDRDLLQLVDENTTVELPPGKWSKGPQIYDPAGVVQKMKVRPDQVVDYKAIVGDTSDNIPGVKGVGDKTAIMLLGEYETLDNIYDNLTEIKARFANKLAEHKDAAYLSQKLARIVTDAPIELDLEACRTHDFDPYPVLDLFETLEFRTQSSRLREAFISGEKNLPGFGPPLDEVEEGQPTETVVVRTAAELATLKKALEQATEIAFDLETTSLDEREAEIVGIALAVEPPVGYYIPVGHLKDAGQTDTGQMNLFAGERQLAEGQLELEAVLTALKPALTNPNIGKIAHNAKYDYAILDRFGIAVDPLTCDTMIAEWLTDPNSKFLGLKALTSHRLRITMTEIEGLIGKGKKQKSFAEVPIEDAAPYAAADADMTLRLAGTLRPEIEELNLGKLLDLEMAIIPVLADMEAEGVTINGEFFTALSADLTGRLAQLESRIHDIAGHPFNVNSTQQLSDVLFKELDLPHERLRKTKSGHFSTASDVLKGIEPLDESGIVKHIIEYRELGKLKSTYVDALPLMVSKKTGRIHTSFMQTGTVTGRIASRNPNLQNIPIRTEEGRRIRQGFIPRPGWLFLAADYSQVELRILAHISQDEALLDAFRQDQDIHRATAAAVYGIKADEVTFNQRRFAKSVNFGLIYGMGAFRLSRDSELTLAEAREFIEVYFERFPGVQQYLDETKRKARENGYVETLLGRRRMFPALGRSGRGHLQQAAEREAINHPIQGSAADIIKVAMIELHQKLTAKYEARMILQVHDELVLELPEHEVDAVRELVINTMSKAYQLDVPLKVDANIGRNWLELKD
ncbi:MAG: DNA polymerase I [Ardenticatenaceae bacterium]|nr:DNA polymerase I [Ardenticatenaceae bacterium]